MTHIPASLIIVSRHRTAALMRALAGVAQMDHPAFEVIVVADPAGVKAVQALGLPLKTAVFDVANISAARNIGLGLAAAPIVAFLDDDAVPEPTWLSRLVAPFANARVTAAGGFVLGRSGLAWQWRAAWVDADGFDHPFETGDGNTLHPGTAQRAIKTHGTNCAFRRDDLLAIGGFDETYRFYLEDADINLRLAAIGGLTAVVPDAVVHHGFAASARRRTDRVPRDMTEIGRSLAHFTTKHGAAPHALPRHIAQQRARMIRHMITGAIEPADVTRILVTLNQGLAAGHAAPLGPLALPAPTAFVRFPDTGPRKACILSGRSNQRAELEVAARAARQKGQIVTLIIMTKGLRAHQHRFTDQSYWLQIGGRFGRSFRTGARLNWQCTSARLKTELARLANFRPV
jgi:hypothetical protein